MPGTPIKVMKKPVYDPARYSAWGDHAQTAFDQGFYPKSSWFNNGTVYASNYDAPFNHVYNPKTPNESAELAFIGYPNKTFDIVIRDKTGNIVHTINKGVSPDFVQDYISNSNSTVAQRNARVLKNTKPIMIASGK